MIQTQEAPRHGERHRETVPPTEIPAHCHKLASSAFPWCKGQVMVQSPCPRGLSAQNPPAQGTKSGCVVPEPLCAV